ncbi:KUP/HAK/KT family potassium transporter [Empedobacter falsenii]
MESNHTMNKVTAATLLIAFGIIYGDIGTSPLYVMKAIIGENRVIDEAIVYGGVSCVFWTLCFQTSIKYVWLTLKADNDGEGGIFSLYSLIKKKGKNLIIPTIIGASALLADGIITPPVSVSSAVEGLRMLNGLEHLPTIPIVILILSMLFFFQRFGTNKVGKIFGPFMVLWFTMLLGLGVLHIVHHPSIIKSLNPYYAYNLLMNYPHGFWILGAVFLCTTGAEALYSDLGHCGRKNIRISWIYVKICLVTNYLGQAAWLMHQDNPMLDGRNPFYEMMPEWFLIPGICIATGAAIIASQALITGSFTLINEAINLGYWPRTLIIQPNEHKSQVYIPTINFLLWAGCVFIVLYFRDSSHMEAAYGLAITITMLMTTFLLSYYLNYYTKFNKLFIVAILSIFVAIESSFFIANVVKFVDGGYLALLMGWLFFVIMYCSFYGKILNSRNLEFVKIKRYANVLTELSEDKTINKYSTFLFYLTKSTNPKNIEKYSIQSILSKRPKRADVYWFVNINRDSEPYTLNYKILPIVEQKIYRITFNIGFRVQPKTEQYIKKVINDMYANGELELKYLNPCLKKYNQDPDMKFVLIEKFPSIETKLSMKEFFTLKIYYILKKIEFNIPKSFGLEKNDVVIEHIPLYVHKNNVDNLKRIE